MIQEMLAGIAIAVTTYLYTDGNFHRSAPLCLLFNAWGQGGVVKEQLRRRDPNFFMVVLGGLAFPTVSIIIRPVRRQNFVPTHWVRK